MRISWNWLSEWLDLGDSSVPTELAQIQRRLADQLTQRGIEVEAIERLDQGLEDVVVAEILSKEKHPQADRLNLCQVSVGDHQHPRQIVCGAQNMKVGDRVALAQVGALLPNGIKISESKIRGVLSQGMLCSAEELKLEIAQFSNPNDGIIILPPTAPLGTPLAKVLGRDDTIFFFKLTVNRGDCLSHWGMAREIAALLDQPLPEWAADVSITPDKKGLKLKNDTKSPVSVSLEVGDDAPRFFGCYIEGITVGPSPEWMVKRLEALGSRSINNVVDATNYVMLELGQPSHAYDADQIQGGKLHVRYAREGESLVLLDGQKVNLLPTEMVVADAQGPLSLGGVMGGQRSEIQSATKNLFLEAAEWSPRLIRKTAVRHQHRTDAAHRFERGIDPAGHPRAMARLIALVIELAGGKPSSLVVEKSSSHTVNASATEIKFSDYELHDFLGFPRDQAPLDPAGIQKILTKLDCQVTHDSTGWKICPPSYRLDLKIKQDVAEELARSVGYDLIPTTVPPLTSSPRGNYQGHQGGGRDRPSWVDRAKDSTKNLAKDPVNYPAKDAAKDGMVRSGFCETVQLAFTSQAGLSQLGLNSSIKLINPLSEEYEMMVPTLLAGLIRAAIYNWNRHFSAAESLAIRLFELRPVFSAPGTIHAHDKTETGVLENWRLSFVLAGPRFAGGLKNDLGDVDFYDVKAVVENLFRDLGIKGGRFLPLRADPKASEARLAGISHLFHPGKSVEVWAGDVAVGVLGLLHPKFAKTLKTRAPIWLAEFDWELLSGRARGPAEVPHYRPSAEYPPIERDFALLARQEISCEKICQLALKLGKPLAKGVKVFDIYRGSQVPEGMTSIAVRVIFYDEGRSLTESEAEVASARLVEGWKKELGIELRA